MPMFSAKLIVEPFEGIARAKLDELLGAGDEWYTKGSPRVDPAGRQYAAYEHSAWVKRLATSGGQEALHSQLKALTEGHASGLGELAKDIELFIGFDVSQENEELAFEADFLKLLGDTRIALRIDAYSLDSSGKDSEGSG